MRFDDDRYYDGEEDNDLWDDELELTADDRPLQGEDPHEPYAPHTSYSPYDDDEPHQNQDQEHDDYYSEPQPEPDTPSRPRRGGIFSKKDEDDDDNDYYDSDHDHEPAPAPKIPKAPRLDPEDPDYWIEGEESPLSELIPKPGKKKIWKLALAIVLILGIAAGWMWTFRPYADSAVKYGYIKHMERRGSIFKTFEGSMIPYKEVGDPAPLYFRELDFSVASDSLAAAMKRMMLGCVPVRVEYETYNTPLPWKGEARMVVVRADTADPRKILPPEFRYYDK